MKSFGVLFASDLQTERVPFTVTDDTGKELECWVDLRPMDSGHLDDFNVAGCEVRMVNDGAGMRQEIGKIDIGARNRFLVSRTLVGWQMWRRQYNAGVPIGWMQDVPSEVTRQREGAIESGEWRTERAFWEWLVGECLRVNGMTEQDAGN